MARCADGSSTRRTGRAKASRHVPCQRLNVAGQGSSKRIAAARSFRHSELER